ncbi:MAG TPA: DUF4129 domain-containing protein [Anaeromyxobacter sp.]|nr:DUF4129 domain-containing protein [Anaeromyxobacter sp.]
MAFARGEALPLALAAAGKVPGAVADEVRRILADRAFQTTLPGQAAPLPLRPLSFSLGPLGDVLLFTAVAVLAGLSLTWLVRRLSFRRRDESAEPEPAGPQALLVPLEGAETLAAAGRYADAIHTLLLETLSALSRAARLAPSLTSREIVAQVPLPEDAGEALTGLVEAVEISRFGGMEPGPDDYRHCLGHFRAFLASLGRWRPAAETPA